MAFIQICIITILLLFGGYREFVPQPYLDDVCALKEFHTTTTLPSIRVARTFTPLEKFHETELAPFCNGHLLNENSTEPAHHTVKEHPVYQNANQVIIGFARFLANSAIQEALASLGHAYNKFAAFTDLVESNMKALHSTSTKAIKNSIKKGGGYIKSALIAAQSTAKIVYDSVGDKVGRTKNKYLAYVQALNDYYDKWYSANYKDGKSFQDFQEDLDKESLWIKEHQKYCNGWLVAEAEKDNCHRETYERFPLHAINEKYLRPLFHEVSPFSSLEFNIAIAQGLTLFGFWLVTGIVVWVVLALRNWLGAMAPVAPAPVQGNPGMQRNQVENQPDRGNTSDCTAIVVYRPMPNLLDAMAPVAPAPVQGKPAMQPTQE